MIRRTNLAIAVSLLALTIASSGLIVAFETRQELESLNKDISTIKTAVLATTVLFPGEPELYARAREEGRLIVYTAWESSDILTTLQVFSKRYPEITTAYWQASNPKIVTRVLTEFQAGQQSLDTVLSDSAPPVLKAAGAIAPYETVQKDFLVLYDPAMPVVGLQIQVLAYNTKLLRPENIPSTWEDVASSKYKGMVCLDDPMRAGPLSVILAALKSQWKNDTRWTNFIKGLKALDVPVYTSTSEMMRLLVAGECSIAMPALLHDALDEKQKGSPMDFVKTAPPIITPRFAAVYARAPHPNAAKLFAEWLISPLGQSVVDELGRGPVRKGFPSRTSIHVVFSPNTEAISVTDEQYLANPKAWLDEYVKPVWQSA